MSFVKNKKFLAGTTSFFLLFVLILPVLIHAEPLVQCETAAHPDPCKFSDFIGLINRIMNWIIGIAGTIFTVSFVYGGFLYMTSGDNPGNKTKATGILWSTLQGFVIILVAWLIVYTILNTLVDKSKAGNENIFNFIKK